MGCAQTYISPAVLSLMAYTKLFLVHCISYMGVVYNPV